MITFLAGHFMPIFLVLFFSSVSLLLIGIYRTKERAAQLEATMERHRAALAEAVNDHAEREFTAINQAEAKHAAEKQAALDAIARGERSHFGGDW
jgi:hypothetical protein